jgi:enoyl-CoA hydratase/carnithine racemase
MRDGDGRTPDAPYAKARLAHGIFRRARGARPSRTLTMTEPAFRHLRLQRDGALHRLSLNRPERSNAVNLEMAQELRRYFESLVADDRARVVILGAEGKHFCAGLDLGDIDAIVAAGRDPLASMRLQRTYAEVILKMRHCPQPIIGLVQGAASGMGLALALACDVRFAADDLRTNVAMAKLGLTGCDVGISYFLPRVIGASNAAEMMMGGRFVNAAKALRMGLVSEIAPREGLAELGEQMAREMLAMSPLGLRLTKDGLRASLEGGSLEAQIALEDRGQVMTLGRHMEEGIRAFKEKRAPRFD